MRSKVFFIFIFTLFIFSCSEDRKWEFRRSLTSPDGLIDLIVDIEKDGGKICYLLMYMEKTHKYVYLGDIIYLMKLSSF